jgi:hypothetical protein
LKDMRWVDLLRERGAGSQDLGEPQSRRRGALDGEQFLGAEASRLQHCGFVLVIE